MSAKPRVAVNGFGRIGRLLIRCGWDSDEFDFVHINDVVGGPETAAYLLKFDSIHGEWDHEVEPVENGITIDGKLVTFSGERALADQPWGQINADMVCDCTGAFLAVSKLQPYFESAGIKRVVCSAPVKEEGVLNVVMGVNEHLLTPEHVICTAASCTTNCLAPVVKVVHENLGIAHGCITTIHDVTATQTLVDMANPKKDDLRRCRAGMLNMAPTSTGSATAIQHIFPELRGKLNGHAVRVPVLNSSLTDCVFEVERPTTVEEVNALMKAAAEGPLAGVLGYEERPLVSTDYTNDPRSSIVDALSTMVIDGTQVKIYAWYDNEFGYANRMVDLVKYIVTTQGDTLA